MKTITRLALVMAVLMGMALTSCNSDSNEDIRTTQQITGCYAAVTDIATGATTYTNGIIFNLDLNWTTAKANITIAGLKAGSALPHIQLDEMDWSIDKDNQPWYQAGSAIVNGSSNVNTSYSFNNFKIKWIDRINLGPALGTPYNYYPGCVFSFELDGKYRVVGSRSPFMLFGETTATGPDGKGYTRDNTWYEIGPDFEHNSATIVIHNAQFAQPMPSMNMQFTNIPMTIDENGAITLSATELIPQLTDNTNTPQPDFPISYLTARIDPAEGMELDFKCNVRKAMMYTVTADVNYTDFNGLSDNNSN